MKKIYNKLPLFILLALSLQGCAKLDQEPYVDLSVLGQWYVQSLARQDLRKCYDEHGHTS